MSYLYFLTFFTATIFNLIVRDSTNNGAVSGATVSIVLASDDTILGSEITSSAGTATIVVVAIIGQVILLFLSLQIVK